MCKIAPVLQVKEMDTLRHNSMIGISLGGSTDGE